MARRSRPRVTLRQNAIWLIALFLMITLALNLFYHIRTELPENGMYDSDLKTRFSMRSSSSSSSSSVSAAAAMTGLEQVKPTKELPLPLLQGMKGVNGSALLDAIAPIPEDDEEDPLCGRICECQVYRFKGYMHHGTSWMEQVIYRLIQIYCKSIGECTTSEYDKEEGLDVAFPNCGKQWVFLAKAVHTNHAPLAKAKEFGIINILGLRDPRDALVSYFEYTNGGVAKYKTQARFDKFFKENFEAMLAYLKENLIRTQGTQGYAIKYEELHRNPLKELRSLAKMFGFEPTDELMRQVITENSFLVNQNPFEVKEAVVRKTKGKFEEMYPGVGEHLNYPLFTEDLLKMANKMMEDELPSGLVAYYFTISKKKSKVIMPIVKY